MDKLTLIEMRGVVTNSLSNGLFRVNLENGFQVIAHISGNIRRNLIKVLPGDVVTVQLSVYDLNKGRIIYRYKTPNRKPQKPLAPQENS